MREGISYELKPGRKWPPEWWRGRGRTDRLLRRTNTVPGDTISVVSDEHQNDEEGLVSEDGSYQGITDVGIRVLVNGVEEMIKHEHIKSVYNYRTGKTAS